MGNPTAHKARKRFGQHFLHDQNIIQKLVNAIHPQAGQSLIEIGPGQGALTFPLLKRCNELTAIELDRDLISLLQQRSQAFGSLHLINMDVLKIELASLPLKPPFRLIGNLPYNISTPLMFHLLESSSLIQDMHFMLQKEVAERIIATPNNKHYGRLSIMMQYYCRCELLFEVPPRCFSPPPRVDSAIIRLIPHAQPTVKVTNKTQFDSIVQEAFNQRRKTIGNSLKNFISRDAIQSLGIDPKSRAENLTLHEFALISESVNE
jgi:16S rRNA (adenine1518-N6/adenine1519-N6)-dimethyltransferase